MTPTAAVKVRPLPVDQIEARLQSCPRLPSLGSINGALRELLSADQGNTSDIAQVIRRDPSLTSRVLRLVNSVYFGLSTPLNNIEEAVFYLGLRQIRQLVTVTPVVEDFQKLAGNTFFRWGGFWQHCVGTAIMTRDVLSLVQPCGDEMDYLAGLVHDVGKIAMASAFPEHFAAIYRHQNGPPCRLREVERDVLGLDHAELGARYLRSHHLPELLVATAQFHHEPEHASSHKPIVASVQIANLLVRHAGIGLSGDSERVTEEECFEASGWKILFPTKADSEKWMTAARTNLRRSLERLPSVLAGLV